MRAIFSVHLTLAIAFCGLGSGNLTAQTQPLVPAADPDALPLIDVFEDNTKITESCRVRLSARRIIADADGNGVLHIMTDGITVVFEDGSVLRGAPREAALNTLEGIGIRMEGVRDVTLKNVTVSGYRCGIWATQTHGLTVDGARLVRNYAQELKSIAQAEDASDWLWPHENDEQQWWKNYGAGIYVERSAFVELNDIHARDQQNGILLDRVQQSKVLHSDCSYLSGWGLGMWRSSDNEVRGNRFDFCIRGYSHGVYNRGQDSAGILMFEQCNRNRILSNSASFSGDGIFAFAGKEALGETEPLDGFPGYRRIGNNGNLIARNRLNYNAAHGLELTFSFDNVVEGNEIIGNAICGIWGGYSQGTAIMNNHFRKNGDAGYGLERGAINVDHARFNHIHGNRFEQDAVGIHIWKTGDQFADTPWGKANDLLPFENLVHDNEFRGVGIPIHLRGPVGVGHHGNQYLDLEGEEIAEEESLKLEGEAAWLTTGEPPMDPLLEPLPGVELGRPSAYHGRHNIVMTPWGPWNHKSPQWLRVAEFGREHHFRLYPADADVRFKFLEGGNGIQVREVKEETPNLGKLYRVRPSMRGFQHYRLLARIGTLSIAEEGVFLGSPWQVKQFASPVDPREDAETWRAAGEAEEIKAQPLEDLRLEFGMQGPEGFKKTDHFGTIATLSVPLPAGKWKILTRSDDGIRVWVDEELVIDDWTHHGATPHEYAFALEKRKAVKLRVEHFELDGAALLDVRLVRDR